MEALSMLDRVTEDCMQLLADIAELRQKKSRAATIQKKIFDYLKEVNGKKYDKVVDFEPGTE